MVEFGNFTLSPGPEQCEILNENLLRAAKYFNSTTVWFLVFAILLFVLMAWLTWRYFRKNQELWNKVKEKFGDGGETAEEGDENGK